MRERWGFSIEEDEHRLANILEKKGQKRKREVRTVKFIHVCVPYEENMVF